ncbi:MAG TPA: hypothetical protein VES20_12130, partial [Bryobacteraceae bacterium]|nr:hypothetical protein [Bryobacteraceae bacterium]
AAPEFRLRAGKIEDRAVRLELTVSHATFKETGPLKMEVRVNGKTLDNPVFRQPGPQLYQKDVPAEMLKPYAENIVQFTVLNPWIAPDGVRLGFLLHGVGFVDR